MRWTTGDKNMKNSSAYPVLFGKAMRICHDLGTQFEGKWSDEVQIKVDIAVRELKSLLPPEGEELPHVT